VASGFFCSHVCRRHTCGQTESTPATRWPRSTPSRESASTPGDWALSSRSLPTSVCTNVCTALLCARNAKWMYNGRVRGSLWFTISAKSTFLGCSIDPIPIKSSVQPPLDTKRPVFNDLWTVGLVLKHVFSTVSLAGFVQNSVKHYGVKY